jgi:hypothetical protein
MVLIMKINLTQIRKDTPLNPPLIRGDFDSFQNWKDGGNAMPKGRRARDAGKDGLTHPTFVDINKDLNSYVISSITNKRIVPDFEFSGYPEPGLVK